MFHVLGLYATTETTGSYTFNDVSQCLLILWNFPHFFQTFIIYVKHNQKYTKQQHVQNVIKIVQ